MNPVVNGTIVEPNLKNIEIFGISGGKMKASEGTSSYNTAAKVSCLV